MTVVKVLPKGQITIPKKIRKHMHIEVGDTLELEESKGNIILKKGKTIFDYIGSLPDLGMSTEEMIEKATEEIAKESG